MSGLLPIEDNRNNYMALCNIEFGGFFVWEDGLFRRLDPGDTPLEIIGITDDQIPVMFMRTGEITGLDRLKLVEPVNCELTIVE